MSYLKSAFVMVVLVVLAGCAGSANYHGGTSYRANNIAGIPLSGSVSVSVSPGGLSVRPNLYYRPAYNLKYKSIK